MQTTTKRDIQYATPVTSYIQIWLNNLVTVFGNAMQTNVQRIFAHEGTEVWKHENNPFRAFSSSFCKASDIMRWCDFAQLTLNRIQSHNP